MSWTAPSVMFPFSLLVVSFVIASVCRRLAFPSLAVQYVPAIPSASGCIFPNLSPRMHWRKTFWSDNHSNLWIFDRRYSVNKGKHQKGAPNILMCLFLWMFTHQIHIYCIKLVDTVLISESHITFLPLFFFTEKRWCHCTVLCEPHPKHWHSTYPAENQQVHIWLSEHCGGLRGGGLSRGKPR